MAACCNIAGPLMTLRFSIKPALDIVACTTTTPWTRAALAIAGYRGTVFSSKLPAISRDAMGTIFGGVALTTMARPVPVPPITLLNSAGQTAAEAFHDIFHRWW